MLVLTCSLGSTPIGFEPRFDLREGASKGKCGSNFLTDGELPVTT